MRVARNDRDTMAAALEGLRRVRARLVQVEKGDAQAELGFGWILKPAKPKTNRYNNYAKVLSRCVEAEGPFIILDLT